jgi:hypothetical protein
MTDIKARGFDSMAQLQEHLDDVDEASAEELPAEYDDPAQKEIAWLRKEVADLREHLSYIRDRANDAEIFPQRDVNPWLRIAAIVATTYVLGRLMQRLRLGAPGAVPSQ